MTKQLVHIITCATCIYFDPFTPYRLSVGECLIRYDYGSGSKPVCNQYVPESPSNEVKKICLKK